MPLLSAIIITIFAMWILVVLMAVTSKIDELPPEHSGRMVKTPRSLQGVDPNNPYFGFLKKADASGVGVSALMCDSNKVLKA